MLSVVMPVYNEEAALPGVLDEALHALEHADFPAEILLVNDASTDRSAAILDSYQAAHPEIVRVLHHQANRGITGACQTLYDNARGDFIFINGSDGQWRTAECLRMMELRDRYDLIVGRRRRKQYSWQRLIVSSAFNLLPALLFGVRTYDAGSIKLFRREVLNIPVLSRGPFREAERIIRARDQKYRIGVIDVDHFSRNGGKAGGAKFSLIAQSVGDLARCWWDMRLTVQPKASGAA
jgi:glycosyltransferase involved in cell wall biosynthesis